MRRVPSGGAARRGPLLLALLLASWGACAAVPQVMSVNELRDYMYREMKYSRACYKVLNSTGAIGCEESTGDGAEGPLVQYAQLPGTLSGAAERDAAACCRDHGGTQLLRRRGRPIPRIDGATSAPAPAGDRTVVVPAAKLAELAAKLQQEPSYKQHIRGILVDSRQQPAADSSAPTFPGAAYSLYEPAGYAWNPAGTGLAKTWFGVPVYLLTDALAAEAEERAGYNQANSFQGTLYQALMSLKMDAKVGLQGAVRAACRG
jgi:nicastrin